MSGSGSDAAEDTWLERAVIYAAEHPLAGVMNIIDALGNPDGLAVVPLAKEALALAERQRSQPPLENIPQPQIPARGAPGERGASHTSFDGAV